MSSKQLILAVGLILVVGGGVLVLAGLTASGDMSVATTTTATTEGAVIPTGLPGVVELQSGDLEGAEAAVQAHLETDPDDIDAWLFLALIHEQAGDLPEAMQVYERLLALDADTFEAHYRIGLLHLKLDDREAAATSFDDALTINSDFTAARVALAEVDAELGRVDEAITLYFEVIEMRPMGVHLDAIRVPLARLLIEVGQSENAAIQLNKALVENPENEEATKLLATLEQADGPAAGPTTTT